MRGIQIVLRPLQNMDLLIQSFSKRNGTKEQKYINSSGV
jgi:hypothetical protein